MKKILLSCCAVAALLFSLCAFLSCSSGGGSDPIDPPSTGITYTIEVSRKNADLSIDRTLQLTATVTPSDPNHTDYTVEWSSLDPSNASVDTNGLVTALAEGTSRIQAKVAGTNTADMCTVTIHPKGTITYNVSVDPSSITLTEGGTAQLTAIVEPSEEGLTDYKVVWTSMTAATVAVDRETGEITALGQTGSSPTQIKATVEGTNFSGTCFVTVNRKPAEYTVERIYRVTLTDKGNGGYSTGNPSAYLSSRAITRRTKQGIAVDESDFPIANSYLQALKDTGVEIATTSKWLATVTVYFKGNETAAQEAAQKIGELDFVEKTELVWQTRQTKSSAPKLPTKTSPLPHRAADQNSYGSAWNNIHIHNGEALHEAGYRGEGIQIAVVDAGFNGLGIFRNNNNPDIKGSKSFIHFEPTNIDRDAHDHGTHVLSCMAGNQDGFYVGTAPKASYWLLRTEHKTWEMPFEEDNMIAAFEYADSVGVDIITCSLTYTDFNDSSLSHSQAELDGKTVNSTRAAEKGFAKGILMVNCAGNESRFVGTPADAEHVLTVGGITPNYTLFTEGCKGWVGSYYKPDVLALADPTPVITPDGPVKSITGTSFATPIIAGLAACLWQAYPNLTNQQLLDVIKQSGNKRGIVTDSHGIPDMEVAMQLAGQL